MFKKTFNCKVFCLEPDFNTMKKNFLEKGKDALAEREKEWEEYEEEMQSIFDGEEVVMLSEEPLKALLSSSCIWVGVSLYYLFRTNVCHLFRMTISQWG